MPGLTVRLVLIFTLAVFRLGCVCLATTTPVLLIDRDSGHPVQGVTIRLSAESASWEFETDVNGQATLADMPTGVYRMQIEKGGYIDPADPDGTGRLCHIPPLGEGRWVIGLVRGVAIAGQITGETGQPLSGMAAIATRRIQAQGQIKFASVGTPSVTDDLGHYRLHHLPPGAYTVAIAPMGDVASNNNQGLIYYPGHSDPSRAEFVELQSGAELTSINIRILPEQHGGVIGSVTGIPVEWPVHRAAVALIPRSGLRLPVAVVMTGASGNYLLEQVPPGEYHAVAWGAIAGSDFSVPPEGRHTRYAAGVISVPGGDTAEVNLGLFPAIRIEARFAPTSGAGGACEGVESLSLRSEDTWPESWTFQSRRSKDGVIWDNVPVGTYRFDMPALEQRCTFLGVQTAEKHESPRQVIALASSTILAAVIGASSGAVSGRIQSKGQPAAGVNVGLWAEGERAYFMVAETDQDGYYKFDRLPSGRYHLHIMDKQKSEANLVVSVRTRDRKQFSLDNAQKIQIDINLDGDE